MAETRERVYRFVGDFTRAYGYSPTYREIAIAVGLKSTSSVLRHLEKLKQEGRVDYVSSAPRTVHVIKKERV